jgi:imidazolonepropionase-like amidohydrolase
VRLALQWGLAKHFCDGADECRNVARYVLREVEDFIKIMVGSEVLSEKEGPEYRQFTVEKIRAIVEEYQFDPFITNQTSQALIITNLPIHNKPY